MIKLSRKMSAWILIILIVISSISIPALVKNLFLESASYDMYEPIDKTRITKERDSVKNAIGDPDIYVEHQTLRFTVGDKVEEIFATKLNLYEEDGSINNYAHLACYNAILANYNFDRYPINGTCLAKYAFVEYQNAYLELCYLNRAFFSARDNAWYMSYVEATENLDLAKKAFFEHDFSAFVSYLETKKDDTYMDPSIIRKIASLDPKGELSILEAEQIIDAIYDAREYQHYLEIGAEYVEGVYIPLTANRRTQIENSLMILNYQIDNTCLISSRDQAAAQSKQFAQKAGRFLLVILLIIIAGSSISQEMATGSIKSLIIAPVKRWKIFTAKLLSLFTWLILGSLLITALTTLSTMMSFGASSLPPYYFVSDGALKTIPHFLFSLLYFLVDNISLFVYLLLAFMISCLTKNTGIAVGVSTGLVLTSSFTSFFEMVFGHHRWIDFLPFSNMDLVSKIFPYFSFSGYLDSENAGFFGIAQGNTLPLSFSITYLAVMVFIILLIAFDAFNRKDIQ